MLKNPRGGMSLRWLRALLDHGIAVRGQVVLCPGVNDGAVFERTMAGVLDQYPELESVAVVPLGLSRFNAESAMRLHTVGRGASDGRTRSSDWQEVFLRMLGRRMVFAADEYYLMAGLPFPEADAYEGFHMHEDGIGMARTFELEFNGERRRSPPACRAASSPRSTAHPPTGYRAPRNPAGDTGLRGCSTDATSTAVVSVRLGPRRDAPIGILTGEFGARVIGPLVDSLGRARHARHPRAPTSSSAATPRSPG